MHAVLLLCFETKATQMQSAKVGGLQRFSNIVITSECCLTDTCSQCYLPADSMLMQPTDHNIDAIPWVRSSSVALRYHKANFMHHSCRIPFIEITSSQDICLPTVKVTSTYSPSAKA